jgi:uncharacterized phage protein gp47/JayE
VTFQIKDFTSIVAGMVNNMRGTQSAITDYNIGSAARTMIEAPAVEMDELYQQTFSGLREVIPVATYQSFNFARLPASAASGVVTLTVTSSASTRVIAAGTVLSTPASSVTYAVVSDVTIAPAATTALVLVSATRAGAVGNIPANSTFSMTPAPDGFVSAINLAAIGNGQDQESDDQRKQRFNQYISTLPRGTNASLVYGAKTAALYDANGVEIERVRAASVEEPYLSDPGEPPALIKVYVHNGAGSTSADLVTRATEVLTGYIDPATGEKVAGYKAAGVKMEVYEADEVSIAVTAELTAAPGYVAADLIAAASATLADYLRSLDMGESYLEAEALYRIKSIAGVVNFTGLPADTAADPNEKIVPGAFTITEA